jgi:hypothetical protein
MQQFVLDGESYSKLPVVSGVPQGFVMGQLLVLTFINDLPADVSSQTHLYANDLFILYLEVSPEKS